MAGTTVEYMCVHGHWPGLQETKIPENLLERLHVRESSSMRLIAGVKRVHRRKMNDLSYA